LDMSEQTSAIQGFETPERAHLAHAIHHYAKARADAETAARRVRRALAAVARSEGGENADPARWGALLTGTHQQPGARGIMNSCWDETSGPWNESNRRKSGE